MSIEIGNRLKQSRKYLQLSQNDFSTLFNIKQATLSQYETGRLGIPDEIKIKLAEKGINLNWLITGKGEMIISAIETFDLKKYKKYQIGKKLKELRESLNYSLVEFSEKALIDSTLLTEYENDTIQISIELIKKFADTGLKINGLITSFIQYNVERND